MAILRRLTALFMAAFLSLFALTGSAHPAHTVLDEANCRLSATILSDCHIEGNNFNTYKNLKAILKDAKNNSFGNDVTVFLGDNTMNGQEVESLLFYGLLAQVKPSEKMVVACGNHDVGNEESDDSYETLINRFYGFNNGVLGKNLSKPYYYEVVNGYYFIVLGPEDLCVNDYVISEEQFKFLDETLALATKEGKPVFVCNHHPYNYSDDWGAEMYSILSKYDNVFYISGHTHVEVQDGWTFRERGKVHTINLPRCTDSYEEGVTDEITGFGIQLEVYDNEVTCRVRNYLTGQWDDSLSMTYEIK